MEITREFLQTLIRSIPEDCAAYQVGEELKALAYSNGTLSVSGYDEDEYREVIETNTYDIIYPEDRAYVVEMLEHAVTSGAVVELRYRLVHRQQGYVKIHTQVTRLGEFEGIPVVLAVFVGTSRAEQMRHAMEFCPAGICILRDTGTEIYRLYYNPHFLKIIERAGMTDEQGMTEPLEKTVPYIHPDDAQRIWQDTIDIFHKGTRHSCEYRIRNAEDGGWTWLYREAFTVPQETGLPLAYMSYSDITARKEADEALKEAQHKFRLAIEGAHLAVWEYDIAEKWAVILERDRSQSDAPDVFENVPESLFEYYDVDDREAVLDLCRKIDEGAPLAIGEFWISRSSDARSRCVRITLSAVFDDKGKPVKAYGVTQNITSERVERQNYERALQQLLKLNPQTSSSFKLNLTKNTCDKGRGFSVMHDVVRASTATRLFDNMASIIATPSDKRAFRKIFDIDTLLGAFKKGATDFSCTYRRRAEQGAAHWATTSINIVQNPSNGDVVAIVSTVDSDRKVKDDMIMQIITDQEYEYIALIHVKDSAIEFRNMSETVPGRYSYPHGERAVPVDYEKVCSEAANGWVLPESRREFIQNSTLGNLVEQLENKQQYSYKVLSKGWDGHRGCKQLHYSYLDDSHEYILVVQEDVTPLYLEQQQQLEHERKLKREALQATKMKSDFLSNVSHDMRTPLNAVLGYTKLAAQSTDVPVIHGYLDKIDKSGEILMQLINDTLDLNKIETGAISLKLESIGSADLFQRIAVAVEPTMQMEGITFNTSFDTLTNDDIEADVTRIQEIFLNLLSNAAKFTMEGGHVDFLVTQTRLTDEALSIEAIVRDDGVGISETFLPRIFEPFSQERIEQTADVTGSGLGLSIVDRLVKMMGGTIEVESKMGEGTTFKLGLSFKRSREADSDDAQEIRPVPLLVGRKVLLCEDNLMNTEIAELILEKQGIEVVSTINGRKGFEAFRDSEPWEYSAVLMDVRMPVMTGHEAARAIRALDREDARAVPIIAMTADAYSDDVERSAEAGMNAHITKPIDPRVLLGELRRLCV